MRRTVIFLFALLSVLLILPGASAQPGGTLPQDSALESYGNPMVIAAAAKDQVRFSVLALATRVRLEVLSESGETVYDSGLRPGNLFEWPATDTQGSQLRDGIYGALVTVEGCGGRVSRRRGVFRVKDGSATFSGSAREARGAAAESEQEQLVALRTDDVAPVTLISHDGEEGWVESGLGGLSFYAGRLARDRSATAQMRLTSEGNVGIGVREPSARLEVQGLIRSSEGFQFSDGTVLKMQSGIPVLVPMASFNPSSGAIGTLAASGTPEAGQAGSRTIRVLAAGGGVTPRFGNETGSNTWYGQGAGASVTTGVYNSFFGQAAGSSNTGGVANSFFGYNAGIANTTGSANSFFGTQAGSSNTTGYTNSFFGIYAGGKNTTGIFNSFFGDNSGFYNTTGNFNSFFGDNAGFYNTTGAGNSFFGGSAGLSSTTESANSCIGAYSDVAEGITNATAFGNRSKVTQSNSLVLGSINGVNGASADTNVGIGITAPERRLHVAETGTTATRGVTFDQYSADSFASVLILRKSRNASPGAHTILQSGDALFNFTGQGSDGTKFVDVARIRMEVEGTPGVSDLPGRITFWTTPDGTAATVERMRIDSNGNVGIGTTSPAERLHVAGNIRYSGTLINAAPDESVPDYVFEPDYRLMPVEELGRFVEREKHLPNVPSAPEIKANGLNLGEFQMKLLEKIEELTLYTVQQAAAIGRKNAEIQALKAQNSALDGRVAVLERMMERPARQERR